MHNKAVDVITTTISGSIKDWTKVKHILPLFRIYGFEDVSLHVAESHREARARARACLEEGGRTIISAGGSGTFNSVLEGCCDAGIDRKEIRLGFLRKGSADLIGKTLGMPDDIESAVRVLAESIRTDTTVPCDVIRAETEGVMQPARHFAGFAGGEIFGEIPLITENRFIKYYKGILGQCFGDLGPFFVGASLTSVKKALRSLIFPKTKWRIHIDGAKAACGSYQALIIVNGYLGKDLPFAESVPLGSGDFHLFGVRDMGLLKLPGQFRRAFNSSILQEPEKWGFETYRINRQLSLIPENRNRFTVNIDGAAMSCHHSVTFTIGDQVRLFSNKEIAGKDSRNENCRTQPVSM
jgi:diacylglycerol kinase family enzyme